LVESSAERAIARAANVLAGKLPQIRQISRKSYVLRKNLTTRKILNLASLTYCFVRGKTDGTGVPFHMKVDVTPRCQLSCPVCFHGKLQKSERNKLPKAMDLQMFSQLVDQVRGRTHVMALYNLGEPLLNKSLIPMIKYAHAANINTYITSNFSLPLSDEFLAELLNSGLTSLIVAVDGISETTFGQQRIGGNWKSVSENLARLKMVKKPAYLQITLQYIVFDHNRHELPAVEEFCNDLGIDLVVFEGSTTPWLIQFKPREGWKPRQKKMLPRCAWPFFSALVGSDGNVYGCCNYRMDEVNDRNIDARPLGSVATESITDIYKGEQYQEARRLVTDPSASGPSVGHFCHGCSVIQK
jgi:MoaA/NifB/PqqE/SkfB family radical SAM enzyme